MPSNGSGLRRQARSNRYGPDAGDATEAQCIIDGLAEGHNPADQRQRPDDETYDGNNGTCSSGTASTVDCGTAAGTASSSSAVRQRRRRPSSAGASAATAAPHAERWPDIGAVLRRQARRTCRPQLLLDRLPIIGWARSYQLGYLYQDFVAGLTVGLTAIPQGIAYAVVAGLEPQYGLYAELLASFVYCVLGSCRNVTIGPTAIMALMVQRFALMSPDMAVLASFASGCVVLALGLLNLGFLVQFISLPVTAGFTTAAAMQIGSLQVKSLLGLPGRSTEFLDAWIHVFKHITETRLWDAVLGVTTIGFLLAMKRLGDVRRGRYASACKYVSLARNALAVLAGSLIAYALTADGAKPPFALTGPIRAGFPPFGPPPFETHVRSANGTLEHWDIGQMLGTMGASLVAVPFVAILEIIVVAKAFADGKTIDATQELIALGCCNIAGSFVRSMPVTGSFTRTAVNNASGVRTPFGGIVTGILVLLSVGFLTETFQYIPKATLAAVIITAMCYMMEFGTALSIWRTRRLDVIPFVATMVACLLLGLDYGIVLGIVVNLLFILYATARPHTAIRTVVVRSCDPERQRGSAAHIKRRDAEEDDDDAAGDDHDDDDDDNADEDIDGGNQQRPTDAVALLVVQPDQSLVFSAAEHLRAKVLRHVRKHRRSRQELEAAISEKATTVPDAGLPHSTTDLQSVDRQVQSTVDLHQPPGLPKRLQRTVVVLDGRHVRTVDVTVARNLEQLRRDLCEPHDAEGGADDSDIGGGPSLVFWRWPSQPEAVAWRLSPALGACFWPAERTLRDVAARVRGEWLAAERTEERLRWQQA